jgi:inorganic phosphate transporter, PiT family
LSGELAAVIAVIVVAMVFDYTNGFHDAANAIATSVSTRALTPRAALIIAAIGNFVGAHFGAKVAKTVGDGLVVLPTGVASLGIVFAGVIGAIGWNLLTWYFGIPSSSTHALFGGLVGATLFSPIGVVQWGNIATKVVVPMVLSPVVGFLLGAVVMFGVLWAVKGLTVASRQRAAAGSSRSPGSGGSAVSDDPPGRIAATVDRAVQPGPLNRSFRYLQSISATAMAVGHGMQDAAKTMGIVVLALYTGGVQDSKTHIPGWVYYTSATVLALGTYAGGWRIIRTLGRRVIHLGPAEGFAAETVASTVLYFNALVLKAPISTTHTITSAIMGVGATKRLSAVRWGVAGNIVMAWVLTFPAAALIAILVHFITAPLFS